MVLRRRHSVSVHRGKKNRYKPVDSNMIESISSEADGKLTNGEADVPVRGAYSFKKRKPMPGAYPKNFSPYTLVCTSATRAVSLSRPDIRNDLALIQQGIAREFSSKYFDESDGTIQATPGPESCVEVFKSKPMVHQKNARVSRRAHLSMIQAPITEAEERRQLRAALKASQLDSSCPAETGSRLYFGVGNYPERRG